MYTTAQEVIDAIPGMSERVAAGSGSLPELYILRMSNMIDAAATGLSAKDKAFVRAFAVDAGMYAAPDPLDAEEDDDLAKDFCMHGLEENTCPCGCFELGGEFGEGEPGFAPESEPEGEHSPDDTLGLTFDQCVGLEESGWSADALYGIRLEWNRKGLCGHGYDVSSCQRGCAERAHAAVVLPELSFEQRLALSVAEAKVDILVRVEEALQGLAMDCAEAEQQLLRVQADLQKIGEQIPVYGVGLHYHAFGVDLHWTSPTGRRGWQPYQQQEAEQLMKDEPGNWQLASLERGETFYQYHEQGNSV